MARGSATFNSLFGDLTPTQTETLNKGRDAALHAARNEFLLDRYFYYGHYTDKRMDAILKTMSETEVFLSERRIYDIVMENLPYLKQLRQAPPSIKDLQRKYPHIVWD